MKKYYLLKGGNSQKKISILLPTYGRPQLLQKTVNSLFKNASNINNIEIFLIIDDNDDKTIISANKLKKEYPVNIILDIDKPCGYFGLNERLNKAAAKTCGDYIFFVDDDSVMKTTNWDEIILNKCIYKLAIYFFKEKNCWGFCHPLIHRDLYNLLGHFSDAPANDAYLKTLSFHTKNKKKIQDIYLEEIPCDSTLWGNERKPKRCNKFDYYNKKYLHDSKVTKIILNLKKNIEKIKNHKDYIPLESGTEYYYPCKTKKEWEKI